MAIEEIKIYWEAGESLSNVKKAYLNARLLANMWTSIENAKWEKIGYNIGSNVVVLDKTGEILALLYSGCDANVHTTILGRAMDHFTEEQLKKANNKIAIWNIKAIKVHNDNLYVVLKWYKQNNWG